MNSKTRSPALPSRGPRALGVLFVSSLVLRSLAACDDDVESGSPAGSGEDGADGSEAHDPDVSGSDDDSGAADSGSSAGDDEGWPGHGDDDAWSPPEDCDAKWLPPPGATKPAGDPIQIEDDRCQWVVDSVAVSEHEQLGASASTHERSPDPAEPETEGDPGVEDAPLESCETEGAARWCDTSPGRQWCLDYAGGRYWSACQCEITCTEGTYRECNGDTCLQCVVDDDGVFGWVEVWDPFWVEPDFWACDPSNGPDTPIVLSFDGGFAMHAAEVSSPEFGLGGMLAEQGRECVVSDWPTADTPWLVIDRDEDGGIDDASELFGSGVRLANGRFARNGFEAMAELDLDRSGTLDARDPAFERLRLWRDDGDRVSQPDELITLAAMGMTSLSVTWSPLESCDERGNCAREASTFEATGSSGLTREGVLLDLHPRCVRREDTGLDR